MSLMAFLPVSLILSIIALISTNAKSQTNQPNTITLGSSLSPNANTTPIWLSPSGIFAFGFYSQNDGFAVGVLMLNRLEATITWTANRDDPPLSSNATLELTHNGELLVRTDQEQGRDKVQLIAKTSSPASSASMLDSGNFVLYDNNSHVIWQSFDSPTDTILGGQNLTSGQNLVSSKSASELSSGRFMLGMQEDGNLVMYPVNSTYSPGDAYWASGFSGPGSNLCLNRTGFLYLQGPTDSGRILANGSSGEKENEINNVIIHRATLDADGIFRLYSHYFWSNKSSRVVTKWSALENRCQVKGFCGFNSFCALEGQESASCHCFPGFDFVDPRSNTLGCYQNFGEDNCRENGASGLIMRYNITGPLQNMWWINNPYSVLPLKKELCSKSCLDDCNCWAVSFTSANDCRKYKLPLRYGTKNENVTATAFFKVVLGNTDTPTHVPPGIHDPEILVRSKNAPIFILALSLGSVAVLCFVFAVSSFVVYRNRAHKYKKLCDSNVGLAEDC